MLIFVLDEVIRSSSESDFTLQKRQLVVSCRFISNIYGCLFISVLFFKGVCNEDGIEKENARNGDSVMRSNSSSSILIAL
jgi:hypothetical protein